MNPDYSQLRDKDLLDKLDDAAFITRFEQSDDWKLFREATKRLADLAEYQMDHLDPLKDPSGIIECQVIKKFCRNVVRSIITGLKAEGALAFEEARERNLNQVQPIQE